jgi:hypothetical protein
MTQIQWKNPIFIRDKLHKCHTIHEIATRTQRGQINAITLSIPRPCHNGNGNGTQVLALGRCLNLRYSFQLNISGTPFWLDLARWN